MDVFTNVEIGRAWRKTSRRVHCICDLADCFSFEPRYDTKTVLNLPILAFSATGGGIHSYLGVVARVCSNLFLILRMILFLIHSVSLIIQTAVALLGLEANLTLGCLELADSILRSYGSDAFLSELWSRSLAPRFRHTLLIIARFILERLIRVGQSSSCFDRCGQVVFFHIQCLLSSLDIRAA